MKLNILEKISGKSKTLEYSYFHFGERLKSLRRKYKLSQADFGKKVGLTLGQVSSYEREASQPTLETILKIAHFFNCALEELTDIPIRHDFYFNWMLDQSTHKLSFQYDYSNKVEFDARAGLIGITQNEYLTYGIQSGIGPDDLALVGANFLLLESHNNNVIQKHFERIANTLESIPSEDILLGYSTKESFSHKVVPKDENLRIDGYPLLISLYMALEKNSWLGHPACWPTRGPNILALKLSSGKIIRLHISSLATGCQLFATYSIDLEKRISSWLELDRKEAQDLAIEYALEWNDAKTKKEIEFEEKTSKGRKSRKG
jgi:DNA-binding helix-turn-helix protein